MRQIQVAQVGCGYWGPNLLRNLTSLPQVKVKLVAEASAVRREYLSAHFSGVPVTASYEDILNDPEIDAVVIATPAHSHSQLAFEFLSSGKHVFVEKPLALNNQEAIKLVEFASNKCLTLMVGHTFLYNNAVRWLKSAKDNGEFGEIYCIYCQRLNLGQLRSDVNSWWNLAPHDLSILLYIMDGQLPEVVSADGKAFIQAGVEDVVFANLKWNEGPLANVHVSWLDPHKMRKVTIVGSKKMAIFDDMSLDAPVTVFDKGFDAIPKHGENMHFDLTPSRAGYALRHGGIQIPSINRVEPLNAELTDFVNSILMEKSPFACNKQACDVVKLLEDGQNALKR